MMKKTDILFSRLVKLMDILRSAKGCPWDRKQNHRSLKICLIEETYEVLDAIDRKNPKKLKEELGDLLYQIIFHSRIAKERKKFDINDVIDSAYKKLVKRHPHVFGNERIRGAEKVIDAWHRRKMKESENSVFDNIPKALPALHKAEKIQRKLSLLGHNWGSLLDILKKIDKDLEDIKKKIGREKKSYLEKILGNLLFDIVSLSYLLKIEPETVLHETINRYVKKWGGNR